MGVDRHFDVLFADPMLDSGLFKAWRGEYLCPCAWDFTLGNGDVANNNVGPG